MNTNYILSYLWDDERVPMTKSIDRDLMDIVDYLPGATKYAKCPCDCQKFDNLISLIMHLNDEKQWTREAIADWLDTLDINTTFRKVVKYVKD